MSTVAAMIRLSDPEEWTVLGEWGDVSPFLALEPGKVHLAADPENPCEAASLWRALERHAASLAALAEMQIADGG